MRAAAALAVAAACASPASALDVKEGSVEGTAPEADGLSQKQLAVLRYLAHLTFMTDDAQDPWKDWRFNGKLPGGSGQESFDSLRYQLSNIAYTAAVTAQRTPAYTEVFGKLLQSASKRMLLNDVWDYTSYLYNKKDTNGGSDPITFKNIMYSAHLAKVMALNELITGDMTHSENTWDFVYQNSKTTFNLTGVMYGMYNQMLPPGGAPPTWATWYEGGGVPCEPVAIFLLCNTFPHNAFRIHDGIHGTRFQVADKRWQDEVRSKAINKVTVAGGSYFKVGYVIAARSWIPQAPIEGGDSWALMWIRGWWNETDPADKELIHKGYVHHASSPGWKVDEKTNGTYHTGTPASFSTIGTSFWTLIERQFWSPDSGLERRSDGIMRYFEQYGELLDMDGDGVKESYRYAKEGDTYQHASVGNLLAGMSFPNDGTQNDVVRGLFQAETPFYKRHNSEPRIVHADYPNVMVPVARYDTAAKVLRFQLVAGDVAPTADTKVELANVAGLTSVTLGGAAFSGYTVNKDGTATLSAPPPTNTPQVWEVRL